MDCDVLAYQHQIERCTPAQGPGERSTAFGEFEATRIGMQGCAPARQPVTRIRNDAPVAVDLRRNHSQQDRPIRTLLAAHACSNRPRKRPDDRLGLHDRVTGHRKHSPHRASIVPGTCSPPIRCSFPGTILDPARC